MLAIQHHMEGVGAGSPHVCVLSSLPPTHTSNCCDSSFYGINHNESPSDAPQPARRERAPSRGPCSGRRDKMHANAAPEGRCAVLSPVGAQSPVVPSAAARCFNWRAVGMHELAKGGGEGRCVSGRCRGRCWSTCPKASDVSPSAQHCDGEAGTCNGTKPRSEGTFHWGTPHRHTESKPHAHT
jgi:hypothetical protein